MRIDIHRLLLRFLFFGIFFAIHFASLPAFSGVVKIHNDQLWIDGQSQPQLFGAEVQYFRLRGGNERNIPRAKVIALWNKALDRVVEAKMNMVSFYLPWDFHEYAEGKFDFDGTVDEDGDGNPDYPSRDVHTFFRLVKEHGIKHIMARPGPYINAEWGFLGFGAVPLWFHEKYPNSHALNPKGQRTTLYSYNDDDFLRHSRIWLRTVYEQVLKDKIGPGKPISFIQIDNETNFMWQSIYNHDYGTRSINQYREYLKSRYGNLENLNFQHSQHWQNFSDIQPPIERGLNLAEDQDWYRFQDFSLFTYLKKIRAIWTELGVIEPQVLFTLAESYNATENGLLPNYKFRNSPEVGMMTVNLYPKTYETDLNPLLNLPFKSDHDVKAADAANDIYLGEKNAWAMGPEIQGGWWKGTLVSREARQQTYLSTIGHGLKALLVYYFNEGNNWQSDWMLQSILPYWQNLKKDSRFSHLNEKNLPPAFWNELNQILAQNFLVVDAKDIWDKRGSQPELLYFDAPLGPDAEIRPPYELIRTIGEKIVNPFGSFLGKAHELEDPVCLVKDTDAHVPTNSANARVVQSDWAGGLLALLMHSGVNARIHHWGQNPKSELLDPKFCKLVIYQDTGFEEPLLSKALTQVLEQGGSVLTFINSGVANQILAERSPLRCEGIPLLPMNVVGFQCKMGQGQLYYAKVPIYDVFNTDFYFLIHDAIQRRGVIDRILEESRIVPKVKFKEGGDRAVIFARANADESELWVTVKTSRHDGFQSTVQWSGAEIDKKYEVTEVLTGMKFLVSGATIQNEGFPISLGDSESQAYYLKPFPDENNKIQIKNVK